LLPAVVAVAMMLLDSIIIATMIAILNFYADSPIKSFQFHFNLPSSRCFNFCLVEWESASVLISSIRRK